MGERCEPGCVCNYCELMFAREELDRLRARLGQTERKRDNFAANCASYRERLAEAEKDCEGAHDLLDASHVENADLRRQLDEAREEAAEKCGELTEVGNALGFSGEDHDLAQLLQRIESITTGRDQAQAALRELAASMGVEVDHASMMTWIDGAKFDLERLGSQLESWSSYRDKVIAQPCEMLDHDDVGDDCQDSILDRTEWCWPCLIRFSLHQAGCGGSREIKVYEKTPRFRRDKCPGCPDCDAALADPAGGEDMNRFVPPGKCVKCSWMGDQVYKYCADCAPPNRVREVSNRPEGEVSKCGTCGGSGWKPGYVCPSCGYKLKDAQRHGDHALCDRSEESLCPDCGGKGE